MEPNLESVVPATPKESPDASPAPAVQDEALIAKAQEVEHLQDRLVRLQAEFEFRRNYPPTINHPAETEFARRVMTEMVGADNVIEFEPTMGAEDFSYYLLEKPGALTLEERRQMQEHSAIGERILAHVDEYSEIARIVRATAPDVVHALHFPTPLPTPHPLVVTLHDLICLDYADQVKHSWLATAWVKRFDRAVIPYALRHADHVVKRFRYQGIARARVSDSQVFRQGGWDRLS